MSSIKCNNVYKKYKDKQVLNGLSFDCENEIAFIAGKNGAGKTTFIRIALGMESADSGSVALCDDSSAKYENKGAVFDTPSLYPYMTCLQNIKILCTGFLKDKSYVEDILNSLNINDELLHKNVGKCSFGQQHRISVAVSLIRKPRFLFLDEPTVGLDPLSWNMVRNSIIENRQKQNGCVIITGQDYFEMASFSDKLIILDEGVSKYTGKTKDFIDGFSASLTLTTFDTLPEYMMPKLKSFTNNPDNSKQYVFNENVDKNEIFHCIQTNNIDVINIGVQQIAFKDAVYSVIGSKSDATASKKEGSTNA